MRPERLVFYCDPGPPFYIHVLNNLYLQEYSRKEMDEQRWALLQQGMTYEEWMGLKGKESQQLRLYKISQQSEKQNN